MVNFQIENVGFILIMVVIDIDRFDTTRPETKPEMTESYDKWRPESYPARPNIYKDEHIYQAWDYHPDKADTRPFHDNGPTVHRYEGTRRPPAR